MVLTSRADAVLVYRDPMKVKRSRSTRSEPSSITLRSSERPAHPSGSGRVARLSPPAAVARNRDGRSVQQLSVLGHHDQLECESTDLVEVRHVPPPRWSYPAHGPQRSSEPPFGHVLQIRGQQDRAPPGVAIREPDGSATLNEPPPGTVGGPLSVFSASRPEGPVRARPTSRRSSGCSGSARLPAGRSPLAWAVVAGERLLPPADTRESTMPSGLSSSFATGAAVHRQIYIVAHHGSRGNRTGRAGRAAWRAARRDGERSRGRE